MLADRQQHAAPEAVHVLSMVVCLLLVGRIDDELGRVDKLVDLLEEHLVLHAGHEKYDL